MTKIGKFQHFATKNNSADSFKFDYVKLITILLPIVSKGVILCYKFLNDYQVFDIHNKMQGNKRCMSDSPSIVQESLLPYGYLQNFTSVIVSWLKHSGGSTVASSAYTIGTYGGHCLRSFMEQTVPDKSVNINNSLVTGWQPGLQDHF